MLGSVVCRFEHFESDWYQRWAPEICGERTPDQQRYHRKPWEFASVAQTLFERGKLVEGMRGLGFAVGTEPMSSFFASRGIDVVATDLDARAGIAKVWRRTGQHGDSRDDLLIPRLVDRERFDRHVRFEFADMNGPWKWPEGSFDFIWSCCAFEHLGSLENGLDFVRRSARLLKPGGVAAHTTEYNVSSNDRTVRRGGGVLYRRRDIEELDRRLRIDTRCLAEMDFRAGEHEYDRLYDLQPSNRHGRQHVKLLIDGYVSTSMLITVVN